MKKIVLKKRYEIELKNSHLSLTALLLVKATFSKTGVPKLLDRGTPK